jgi:hypothetical protein
LPSNKEAVIIVKKLNITNLLAEYFKSSLLKRRNEVSLYEILIISAVEKLLQLYSSRE